MKRRTIYVIIGIVIVFIAISISIYFYEKKVNPPFFPIDQEFTNFALGCNTDEECIRVDYHSCCSSGESINKNKFEEWKDYIKKNNLKEKSEKLCELITCPAPAPAKPVCQENKCTLIGLKSVEECTERNVCYFEMSSESCQDYIKLFCIKYMSG